MMIKMNFINVQSEERSGVEKLMNISLLACIEIFTFIFNQNEFRFYKILTD